MIIRSAIAWLVFVIGASVIVAFVRPISEQVFPLPSIFAERDSIKPEPTPEPILPNPTLHGIATHYDAERNGETTWYSRAGIEFYGAAGPDLRKEVRHKWRNSVDLAPAVWNALGVPLHLGVTPVSIELLP